MSHWRLGASDAKSKQRQEESTPFQIIVGKELLISLVLKLYGLWLIQNFIQRGFIQAGINADTAE